MFNTHYLIHCFVASEKIALFSFDDMELANTFTDSNVRVQMACGMLMRPLWNGNIPSSIQRRNSANVSLPSVNCMFCQWFHNPTIGQRKDHLRPAAIMLAGVASN